MRLTRTQAVVAQSRIQYKQQLKRLTVVGNLVVKEPQLRSLSQMTSRQRQSNWMKAMSLLIRAQGYSLNRQKEVPVPPAWQLFSWGSTGDQLSATVIYNTRPIQGCIVVKHGNAPAVKAGVYYTSLNSHLTLSPSLTALFNMSTCTIIRRPPYEISTSPLQLFLPTRLLF